MRHDLLILVGVAIVGASMVFAAEEASVAPAPSGTALADVHMVATAFRASIQSRGPEKLLWWSLGALNRELQATVLPFILAGDPDPSPVSSHPAVYVRAWRLGPQTLVLAVNPSAETAPCTIQGLPRQSGEARSFGRRWVIREGRISDRLLPLDVRAYVIE